MTKFYGLLAATALTCSTLATAASAGNVDFTTLANGTAVYNQFAGVTFSATGGPEDDGSPLASNFWSGGTVELNNSTSGSYPTSDSIVADFSSGVSGIQFWYENYGASESGRGASTYTAYDADNNVVSAGFLGFTSYDSGLISIGGSGITRLVWSNNTGGNDSWEFGIRSVSFNGGAVPEPASWALMLGGFGLVGGAMRRSKTIVRFA